MEPEFWLARLSDRNNKQIKLFKKDANDQNSYFPSTSFKDLFFFNENKNQKMNSLMTLWSKALI